MITINNFVTPSEITEIVSAADVLKPPPIKIANEHIRKVNEATYGWSVLCNFTDTKVANHVSQFQGDATVVATVPKLFYEIAERIAASLEISEEHVFFQYILIGANGKVAAHYDAGMPGYITYKCNVCVSGPDLDVIYVGKDKFDIRVADLYCFEANLYKHWLESSDVPRIHLSYGFILPYDALGWEDSDPRVRLSNRIWKAFIDNRMC